MGTKFKYVAIAALIVIVEMLVLSAFIWLANAVLGNVVTSIILSVLVFALLFVTAYSKVRKNIILRRRRKLLGIERLNKPNDGKIICTHEQMRKMMELGIDISQAKFIGAEGALFNLSEVMNMLMIPEIAITGKWAKGKYRYLLEYNDGTNTLEKEDECLLDAGVDMVLSILRLQGIKTKAEMEDENGK
ncbi:MAG: hypothetical protein IJ640_10510 [Prevotella sp.]|nr:hypothetical protein [Prevotella sp.]